jgi:hypothetical protein
VKCVTFSAFGPTGTTTTLRGREAFFALSDLTVKTVLCMIIKEFNRVIAESSLTSSCNGRPKAVMDDIPVVRIKAAFTCTTTKGAKAVVTTLKILNKKKVCEILNHLSVEVCRCCQKVAVQKRLIETYRGSMLMERASPMVINDGLPDVLSALERLMHALSSSLSPETELVHNSSL